MNGPQDMGGMMGFGAVAPDPHEPLFYAAWERRALGLSLAMGPTGSWNIDQSRHARETLPPQTYWSASYYQIWIEGLSRLLLERKMASAEELATGHALSPGKPVKRILQAGDVAALLAKGTSYERPTETKPLFAVGQTVSTRRNMTPGHTRLPKYAQHKSGTIVRLQGCHVFPDQSSIGKADEARWLYAVSFSANELWGSTNKDSVTIDLFEPYLEVAA